MNLLAISLSTSSFWFRVIGYGLSIRWRSTLLPSEKYSNRKVFRYKNFAIELLWRI